MNVRIRIRGLAFLLLTMTSLAVVGSAQAIELLVPAYFYPAGKGLNFWNQMTTAAPKAPVIAILNPNSGPGTSVDPAYVNVVANLRAAGGKVIGYVHTSYGARPLAQVTQEVLLYRDFYGVDGYFIDEMAYDGSPASVNYYAALYAYIKALNPNWRVIGNPGTHTQEIYLSYPTVDAVVIFEGSAKAQRRFAPNAWTAAYPSSRLGELAYSVGDINAARASLDLAAQDNAALVYTTNDKLNPNPWDTLPAYWSALVSEICLRNGGSAAVCN